jgi:hypothetical protein
LPISSPPAQSSGRTWKSTYEAAPTVQTSRPSGWPRCATAGTELQRQAEARRAAHADRRVVDLVAGAIDDHQVGSALVHADHAPAHRAEAVDGHHHRHARVVGDQRHPRGVDAVQAVDLDVDRRAGGEIEVEAAERLTAVLGVERHGAVFALRGQVAGSGEEQGKERSD